MAIFAIFIALADARYGSLFRSSMGKAQVAAGANKQLGNFQFKNALYINWYWFHFRHFLLVEG